MPTDVTRPSPATTGEGVATARALAVGWMSPSPMLSWLEREHTFGRDLGCDTVLPGEEVSRLHARVVFQGLVPALRDCGSSNGLFVNGQRVQETGLTPGQVVRIGAWVGLIQYLDRQAEPVTLRQIIPGWFGGELLCARVEPLRRVASSDLPVVIEGETGSGKEGAARAVHAFSGRCGPFVAVDCGALAVQLSEALLFGHKKGAFTGANQAGLGYLRAAHGGTLFLDEVLNLDLATQAKLLRALELREVVPVGEERPVAIDVRVVCAAQRPLAEAVRAGQFREDLRARLEGYCLPLPPLRERREDVVPLFLELLRSRAGAAVSCEPRLIESLLLHDWPRNVRELGMVVKRLVAVHGAGPLRRSMLPPEMCGAGKIAEPAHAGSPPPGGPARKPAKDEAQLSALIEALHAHGGNRAAAARALGLSRSRANRVFAAHPELARSHKGKDGTS